MSRMSSCRTLFLLLVPPSCSLLPCLILLLSPRSHSCHSPGLGFPFFSPSVPLLLSFSTSVLSLSPFSFLWVSGFLVWLFLAFALALLPCLAPFLVTGVPWLRSLRQGASARCLFAYRTERFTLH